MDILQKINILLERKGVSANKMSMDLGFSNGVFYQWKKGLQKPSADKIAKMADYFEVSTDYLLGNSENEKKPALSEKDERDIAKKLERIKDDLVSQDGLMFDGVPMNEETMDYIFKALETGLRTAKVLNKETYTPKKYKEKKED